MKQRTIAKAFSLSGTGIHSGTECSVSFSPAPPNRGIVFIHEGKQLPALAEFVKETRRGTTLGKISVVEHVLSAVSGMGIDNLLIEVSGEEPPALDGSALPYAEALRGAGISEQSEEKEYLPLERPVKISEGESSLEALPGNGFSVDFMIDFPAIGEQRFSFDLSEKGYLKEIAPARTFGLIEEYEMLKNQGLARGATMENALVLGKDGYINPPRFPDEPVRHKILDLIGDLALAGKPIRARIKAVRSGHKLNIELVRRILKT